MVKNPTWEGGVHVSNLITSAVVAASYTVAADTEHMNFMYELV